MRPFRFGPLKLTSTYTTNILNPGTTTGGVNSTAAPYDKLEIRLRHLRITNVTGTAATFRLFIDGTGGNTAGKEIEYGKSVPSNSSIDLWFTPGLLLVGADFLVGGASADDTLTIMGEGEIGVAA